MEIRFLAHGSVTVLELVGRLDDLSAPELELSSMPTTAEPGVPLLLDMTHVEYVSSGGLRVLVMLTKATRKAGRSLMLCGLNPFVQEVLEISNLKPLFSIHSSRQHAVDSCADGFVAWPQRV